MPAALPTSESNHVASAASAPSQRRLQIWMCPAEQQLHRGVVSGHHQFQRRRQAPRDKGVVSKGKDAERTEHGA
jgi:hypothetical protein